MMARRQNRDQRQNRHHRNVLEEQHGESAPPILALRGAALLKKLHRDGGRGEGKRNAGDECAAAREPDQQESGEPDDGTCDEHLAGAEQRDVAAHGKEPRRFQFEPDDEEQQNDAEFSDIEHRRRVGDERETEGPIAMPATR